MGGVKLFLLFILSFSAAFLISKTIERSLKFRGLPHKKVLIYRWTVFGIFFITLLILGFFG